MEQNPVLIRFFRGVIGRMRHLKMAPMECFWRGGMRPCFRCWSLTIGITEPKAICYDCQEESNNQICTDCGKTKIDDICKCNEATVRDYEDDSYHDYDDEYEEPDHSGPCHQCGRQIRGTDWAWTGHCSRHCATSYDREGRRFRW